MTDFYNNKRVLVTGGHGFLGKHLVRKLTERGGIVIAPPREHLDLTDSIEVTEYSFHSLFDGEPLFDMVFHLAAHVGGIHYNSEYPWRLLEDNVLMALSAINLASAYNAKLIAAGSVCAYPKLVPVPTIEENLYQGYPEESNGAYGNAKRILLEAQKAAYREHRLRSVHLVSANLYGPGDNFDPEYSHVIPALIVKVQEAIDTNAPHIKVWGTGRASRDFLYVEDAADAYLAAGEFIDGPPEPINIASGNEVPIHFLVSKLKDIMGYDGSIVYDTSKPDGQPRRAFKITKMHSLTGWSPSTKIDDGLAETVEWYRENIANKES